MEYGNPTQDNHVFAKLSGNSKDLSRQQVLANHSKVRRDYAVVEKRSQEMAYS